MKVKLHGFLSVCVSPDRKGLKLISLAHTFLAVCEGEKKHKFSALSD